MALKFGFDANKFLQPHDPIHPSPFLFAKERIEFLPHRPHACLPEFFSKEELSLSCFPESYSQLPKALLLPEISRPRIPAALASPAQPPGCTSRRRCRPGSGYCCCCCYSAGAPRLPHAGQDHVFLAAAALLVLGANQGRAREG